MHVMIKGNYFNLDDVLAVSEIRSVGNEGAQLFSITLKNGNTIEFFYHRIHEDDVKISNGNFIFGTSAFFLNARKEILNKLTNATQLPSTS